MKIMEPLDKIPDPRHPVEDRADDLLYSKDLVDRLARLVRPELELDALGATSGALADLASVPVAQMAEDLIGLARECGHAGEVEEKDLCEATAALLAEVSGKPDPAFWDIESRSVAECLVDWWTGTLWTALESADDGRVVLDSEALPSGSAAATARLSEALRPYDLQPRTALTCLSKLVADRSARGVLELPFRMRLLNACGVLSCVRRAAADASTGVHPVPTHPAAPAPRPIPVASYRWGPEELPRTRLSLPLIGAGLAVVLLMLMGLPTTPPRPPRPLPSHVGLPPSPVGPASYRYCTSPTRISHVGLPPSPVGPAVAYTLKVDPPRGLRILHEKSIDSGSVPWTAPLSSAVIPRDRGWIITFTSSRRIAGIEDLQSKSGDGDPIGRLERLAREQGVEFRVEAVRPLGSETAESQ